MLNTSGQLALAAVILIIVIFLVLLLPSGSNAAETSEQPLDDPPSAATTGDHRIREVTDHIRRFHLSVCGRDPAKHKAACVEKIQRTARYKRAPQIAKWIVAAADEHLVDPITVSEIARSECGYREGKRCPVGKKGERGMGQFMPGGRPERMALEAGYDLTTSKGQLRGIALVFADSLEVCGGDELAALRRYQTGSCNPCASKSPARRFRRIEEARALVANAD